MKLFACVMTSNVKTYTECASWKSSQKDESIVYSNTILGGFLESLQQT